MLDVYNLNQINEPHSNSNGSSARECIIAWPILQISASIAIRIVSRLKYRDTYRIVRVSYRYNPNKLSHCLLSSKSSVQLLKKNDCNRHESQRFECVIIALSIYV